MDKFQTIFFIVYGSVLGWLSLSSIRQGKQIVVQQATSGNIDRTLTAMDKKIDALGVRIDLFMKNEIDVLKDISKSFVKNGN
ncbi:MAG TPA: hypothetical protein VL443_24430 [Cyclobacteriaceae bacterium]|jgi:hypothetical protein|nr:hypothetical protein [Cyclobacteriaceae bacterium]